LEKRWISVRECSSYLGLHPKSVYRLIDKGEIPAGRVGHSVRIDLRKLEEILETRNQEKMK